jgi:hypothetical protein
LQPDALLVTGEHNPDRDALGAGLGLLGLGGGDRRLDGCGLEVDLDDLRCVELADDGQGGLDRRPGVGCASLGALGELESRPRSW